VKRKRNRNSGWEVYISECSCRMGERMDFYDEMLIEFRIGELSSELNPL
jgi:hypothetical protein